MPLCNELDLSVNELLTGERISETEYREKAEENMVNLVKEAQESKKKIILSGMVSALVIIAATQCLWWRELSDGGVDAVALLQSA